MSKENSYDDKENSIKPSAIFLKKMSEDTTDNTTNDMEVQNNNTDKLNNCDDDHSENNDDDQMSDVDDDNKSTKSSKIISNSNNNNNINNNNNDESSVTANLLAAGLTNGEFNPAAFFPPPGQMSIQAFQNAIAQFTANALANNMDNETVMKNLAILQSALFTLQQQQFLQFQLIQHLQSQLVKKQSDKDDNVKADEQSDNKSDSSKRSANQKNENSNNSLLLSDNLKRDRDAAEAYVDPDEDDEMEEEGVEDEFSKNYQQINRNNVLLAKSEMDLR